MLHPSSLPCSVPTKRCGPRSVPQFHGDVAVRIVVALESLPRNRVATAIAETHPRHFPVFARIFLEAGLGARACSLDMCTSRSTGQDDTSGGVRSDVNL